MSEITPKVLKVPALIISGFLGYLFCLIGTCKLSNTITDVQEYFYPKDASKPEAPPPQQLSKDTYQLPVTIINLRDKFFRAITPICQRFTNLLKYIYPDNNNKFMNGLKTISFLILGSVLLIAIPIRSMSTK